MEKWNSEEIEESKSRKVEGVEEVKNCDEEKKRRKYWKND
ncbi:hypothetical protein ES705_32964 [subsurface metagenome]